VTKFSSVDLYLITRFSTMRWTTHDKTSPFLFTSTGRISFPLISLSKKDLAILSCLALLLPR
jgi:hypothetical protein